VTAAARLNELAAEWRLPAAAARQLDALLEFVAGDSAAPTTVRDPGLAVEAHVADSLTGLLVPELATAGRIADLGAGAGFPGLPLAIARPDARVDLVESNARKCVFLERAAAVAGVQNVSVVRARAEEWHPDLAADPTVDHALCDVVTARALASLPVLVEYAAPLLREGGVLVAWKGKPDDDEEMGGARAAALVGLQPEPPIAVAPTPRAEHRHLHVFRKVRATPPTFPRRPGMARKRPLA
jgi:16S rRNA (guanine527-N7)-methyltransferase